MSNRRERRSKKNDPIETKDMITCTNCHELFERKFCGVKGIGIPTQGNISVASYNGYVYAIFGAEPIIPYQWVCLDCSGYFT